MIAPSHDRQPRQCAADVGAIAETRRPYFAENVRCAAGKGSRGMLLLFSDQPRGLSQRQRSWAAAIASKLGSVCV